MKLWISKIVVRGLKKIINSQRTHIVKMRMNYIEKLNPTRSEKEGRSVNVSWFFKNLVNRNQ